MEEARAVIARLDRIEQLDRAGASPERVLAEIERLLPEAQAWLEREGAPLQLRDLLETCRAQLSHPRGGSATLRPA